MGNQILIFFHSISHQVIHRTSEQSLTSIQFQELQYLVISFLKALGFVDTWVAGPAHAQAVFSSLTDQGRCRKSIVSKYKLAKPTAG